MIGIVWMSRCAFQIWRTALGSSREPTKDSLAAHMQTLLNHWWLNHSCLSPHCSRHCICFCFSFSWSNNPTIIHVKTPAHTLCTRENRVLLISKQFTIGGYAFIFYSICFNPRNKVPIFLGWILDISVKREIKIFRTITCFWMRNGVIQRNLGQPWGHVEEAAKKEPFFGWWRKAVGVNVSTSINSFAIGSLKEYF